MGMRVARAKSYRARCAIPAHIVLVAIPSRPIRIVRKNSLMEFSNIESITRKFRDLGVTRMFCKALAENDNIKQQIYLGGSFEVLKLLPYREVRSEPGLKRPNFKAPLLMSWVDSAGQVAEAPGAQLILYPDYPEVRLSGFVQHCPTAPSMHLQPIPRNLRKYNNGPDGRILFLGVSPDRGTYAYLAPNASLMAEEFRRRCDAGDFESEGVFWRLPIGQESNPRVELLSRLREIHKNGWHLSCKLNKAGQIMPYQAQNGGGYTLEALLGVKPNAVAGPDFMGWEIKGYSGDKVTLMTPEPDAGYYGKHGVEAFVRKYGRKISGDRIYFTGGHRANQLCNSSGQMLRLNGFDASNGKILDVSGGIELVDEIGNLSAAWSFRELIERWGKKHAAAAYVPYEKKKVAPPEYRYKNPVFLGEGTEFSLYLLAISSGLVIYDPGSKVMNASTKKSTVKARSQFRIPVRHLGLLYRKFEAVDL